MADAKCILHLFLQCKGRHISTNIKPYCLNHSSLWQKSA